MTCLCLCSHFHSIIISIFSKKQSSKNHTGTKLLAVLSWGRCPVPPGQESRERSDSCGPLILRLSFPNSERKEILTLLFSFPNLKKLKGKREYSLTVPTACFNLHVPTRGEPTRTARCIPLSYRDTTTQRRAIRISRRPVRRPMLQYPTNLNKAWEL